MGGQEPQGIGRWGAKFDPRGDGVEGRGVFGGRRWRGLNEAGESADGMGEVGYHGLTGKVVTGEREEMPVGWRGRRSANFFYSHGSHLRI